MRTVTVDIELKDEFLSDVMCIALEGGIGYWCVASKIVRSTLQNSPLTYMQFNASDVDGDDFKSVPVNFDTIANGIKLALEPDARINGATREAIFRGVTCNDAGEIDADAADAIVQFGMFGRIVYG